MSEYWEQVQDEMLRKFHQDSQTEEIAESENGNHEFDGLPKYL